MNKNYSLYYNKKTLELIIKPDKYNKIENMSDDKVYYWNENYYYATNRKVLREKANELKEQWIEETEERLNKLKELKVKTKY